MSDQLKICMVIPAYNEQRRISTTLDSFTKTLLKSYPSLTILVVVQGNDRTFDIASKYAKKYSQIKSLDARDSIGKGASLIRGFHWALANHGYEVVGFTDADPSVPPKELAKLIDQIEKKDVDGAIGSRYLPESKIIGNLTAKRMIVSRGYNLMVRALFGLNFKDTQCGAKFFKSKALKTIMKDVHLTEMSFDINLLYELSRRKFNVREVPIVYKIVNEGSNVTVSKQVPKMFVVTLCYRITRSPINRILPEQMKLALFNWVRKW